jgi:hypothetical protein
VLRFLTRFSWSRNSSGCSERKKGFLKFQTGLIIDAIEDDILLDD